VSFSVIIPARNEQERIDTCVANVREVADEDGADVEVIVVDGGSDDETALRAAAAGARVVAAAPGRGSQCNAGADVARGEVLLFLHADTLLPAGAFRLLTVEMTRPAIGAGTFRLRFDERHWLFSIYTAFSRFDSVLTTFGDQCIVIRRELFEGIGGFPEWPLFDDVALLQRARQVTRIRSFPATVITSARRFRREGVIRQSLRNAWYVVQYLLGASPYALAVKYERSRRD
jgi:rSAM/selenodomain-associated transferase 2